MRTLTIGQVAEQAGLQPSALRYYERIGLLPRVARENGQRRYDHSILHRLRLIVAARRAGFTIAEIHTLIHGFTPEAQPAQRWAAVAPGRLNEIDQLILRLQSQRALVEATLACACPTLDDCGAAVESLP